MSAIAPRRCAIYTRKSSEEGLEQAFNSLDAQREACAAYILSQAGEGWMGLPNLYDDGGFSGGNMERPSLKALLADIDRGLIDIVVVYKVDRLTRSLGDFGRIVERFDGQGVSFVSVTQAFNTTTSMGRLTLNVLLSFAQFEREVTGERIRDKIAASKAKGLWMGGNVPLGYDADGRTLKIDPAAAETVRHIYRRYLELGSVHRLREELEARGVRSKLRTSLAGRTRGGVAMSRGALFHLLSNRVYLGEVPHKALFHPGLHPPLIDRALFDAVQARLLENAGPKRRRAAGMAPLAPASPLAGLLRDDLGRPMSPVAARGGAGQIYRYYVCAPLQQGQLRRTGVVTRVPALALETLVLERSIPLGLALDPADPWPALRSAITSVRLQRDKVAISYQAARLDPEVCSGGPANAFRLGEDAGLQVQGDQAVLTIAAAIGRRGGSRAMTGPHGGSAICVVERDAILVKALARAQTWRRALVEGRSASVTELAQSEGLAAGYVARVLRLAFLAPDLKHAILQGRQAAALNLERFMRQDLPLDWGRQRRLFAAHASSRSL